MKKVLILSPFYPPFPRPGATKRTENFVRYLPETGWKPLVLTMDWGFSNEESAKVDGLYYTRNIAYASWKAYHVADVEQESTWKTQILRSIINVLRSVKTYVLIPDELVLWLFWVLPRMRHIVRTGRPDVLYATAPPNSSLLTAVVLKKLFHIPLVCDIRDDWCSNPTMEKKSRFLRRVEKCMERWIALYADKIILVTSASRTLWSIRYPAEKHKLVLISNGYSEDEYNEAPAHIYPEVAIVHVGSLELNRSPEPLYKALSKMGRQSSLNIGFYQYGLTLREFQDRTEHYGITNRVHFTGTIPAREAISRIKGASLLVLFPTQNAPTAIPGKAYEYLRTGKPVLTISRENATTEFMKDFPQVTIVDPDDTESCIALIKKIADNRSQMQGVQDCTAIKRFDRRNLTKTLALAFNSILDKANRPSRMKKTTADMETP